MTEQIQPNQPTTRHWGAFWFGLILAGAMNFSAWFFSDKIALATSRARPATEEEFPFVYEIVRDLTYRLEMPMPSVHFIDSPQPNAFATGARRNSALVAVSTGLLESMSKDEVEAVLAHEVSHVANGDMITMALMQGVVNTFVIFFSRIIGHVVDRVVFKTERGYGPAYFITSIVAQIFLSIIASTIVMWFSRRREFRADAGGADLAGRRKMIGALKALQRQSEPQDLPGEFAPEVYRNLQLEGRDTGLGGRVVGLAELALLSVHRRDVHDPAEAAGDHAGKHRAGHVVDAVQVRAEHGRPLFRLEVEQPGVAGDPSRVHQDIDGPQRLFNARHTGHAGGVIRDVERKQVHVGVAVLQTVHPGLGGLHVAGMAIRRHRAAGLREGQTDFPSDRSGAARYESYALGHYFLQQRFGIF